jgi:hypothetical protein
MPYSSSIAVPRTDVRQRVSWDKKNEAENLGLYFIRLMVAQNFFPGKEATSPNSSSMRRS